MFKADIMKELLKAEKIHKEIVIVDKEIVKLEKILDSVVRDNITVKVKARMLVKDKKVEKKEDSSECNVGVIAYTFSFGGSGSSSDKKEWDLNDTLTSTEFVIMYVRLLDYKKELRKSLIQDFNKLSLKLKI